MTAGPYQANVTNAVSITARDNPPEGRQVLPFAFILTPINFNQSQSINLGSANISQIRAIYVDNSSNPMPLTLVHGAAQTTSKIPAGGGGFIPTTSTQGTYFIQVFTDASPSNNINIGVELYNYAIPPAIFGNTIITNTTVISVDTLPNPFFNAGCTVAQRGFASGGIISPVAPASGASVVTVDGWYLADGSASGTLSWSQGGVIGRSNNSLNFKASTASQIGKVSRKISAQDAAPYLGQTVIFQFKLFNGTGASFAPVVRVSHATQFNNFAAVTADIVANAQSCPVGATTQCAIAFVLPATTGLANGMQVDILTQLSSATSQCAITDLDLSLAYDTAPGLAVPSLARLKSYSQDLYDSQFYFDTTAVNGAFTTAGMLGGYGFAANSGATLATFSVPFARPMTSAPSLTIYDATGAVGKYSQIINTGQSNGIVPAAGFFRGTSNRSALIYPTSTGGSTASALFNYTASAEL